MVHPMHTNYIIPYVPDGWSVLQDGAPSPSGDYEILDNATDKTAAELGYTTAHVYPTSITDSCPDAPDSTHAEAEALSTLWASEYGVV